MKINIFNGGLNVRQAPELIQANEALVCNNVCTNSDQVTSCLGLANGQDVGTFPYYFEAEDIWLGENDVRSYLPYQNKLYWVDGEAPKKYFNGTVFNLGISAPTAAPTAVVNTTAGNLNGTFQYVYTYYNVNDGTESAPSPVSEEVSPSNEQVDLTVATSSDPQVTHIKIYRVGTGILNFTEIEELPYQSVSFTDNVATLDIIGNILSSQLNTPAPAGLKYLKQAYGIFFGAVGSKLYYSRDIGNPNYWPEVNYISFEEDITGIGVASSGIVVFTKYATHLVSGTSIASFTKYQVDNTKGCINGKTVVEHKGAVLFVSAEGVCAIENSAATHISKFKLGTQELNTVNAVVHNDSYYVQLADNSILCFDMQYGPMFKTYNFGTNFLTVAENKLYALKDLLLYEMFTGAPVELSYETGNLTDGSSSMLKQYNSVYLDGAGEFKLAIYIDDIKVQEVNIVFAVKPYELAIPQQLQRGSRIRFSFSGTGTIKEIEYKAGGRQNGK